MLNDTDLEGALRGIPTSFKQAHRLVKFLADNPKACTVAVNQACSIGNISDVARRINPHLYERGLYISCQRPLEPILNRFREPSQMFEWELHNLGEQPNASAGLQA
jgi:hypothetical protein